MTQRKHELIQCRVTSNQYERVKNLTAAKGFLRIADYMRYCALEKDLAFERKLEEIKNEILNLRKEIQELKIKKEILRI